MTALMPWFLGFRLGQRQRVVADRTVLGDRLGCRAYADEADPGRLCGAPAGWLVTAACPHEHVVPSLACGPHADDLRCRLDAGKVPCRSCRACADPHMCLVSVEFLPLGRQQSAKEGR